LLLLSAQAVKMYVNTVLVQLRTQVPPRVLLKNEKSNERADTCNRRENGNTKEGSQLSLILKLKIQKGCKVLGLVPNLSKSTQDLQNRVGHQASN